MVSDHHWTKEPLTILGLSKSGCAVARYVQKRGGQCFISETLPATPKNESLRQEMLKLGVEVEMGGHSKRCFTHAPLVVTSPGIPPSSPIMNELRVSGIDIISEVELAYRETQVPLIGITGTNGKTTTTTLISKLLTQFGYKAPACGNIGRPVIAVLDEEKDLDYLVVELSSFQLAYSPTLKAKIGVFTNFKPDHLDWHGSVEAYLRAKLVMFTGEQSPEWSVILADDPACQRVETYTRGKVLPFSRHQALVSQYQYKAYLDERGQVTVHTPMSTELSLFSIQDLKLLGQHNYENLLASVATASLLGVTEKTLMDICLSFEGVEHRLEPVTTIRGVTFYNDSKATNPDATLSALQAFDSQKKVVLIAGGRDKRGPLDEFVESVQRHVSHVVLLGEAKERFLEALTDKGFHHVSIVASLEEAVEKAFLLSKSGVVLFSPACASFDMFQNFEERGQVFKSLVHVLAKRFETVESPGVSASDSSEQVVCSS